MPQRYCPDQLRQVSAIRDLQRTAAEERAGRAAATMREQEAKKQESERARDETAENWLDAVSAPSISVDMSRLWSVELNRRQEHVSRAGRNVDLAATDLKQRTGDWHLATVRSDSARELFDAARKERRKQREEGALQDAADRLGQLAWWRAWQ